MTSQRVERTWIRTGGYGRFRGEWVKFENIRIGNQSGKIRVENALFFEVSLASLGSQQAVSTVLISFAVI